MGATMHVTDDWSPGEHLARVLLEERAASDMARRIQHLVENGEAAELAAELGRFRAFLARELEVHFAKEEDDLFPIFARRGLETEVAQAKDQHAAIRRLGARLAAGCGGEAEL